MATRYTEAELSEFIELYHREGWEDVFGVVIAFRIDIGDSRIKLEVFCLHILLLLEDATSSRVPICLNLQLLILINLKYFNPLLRVNFLKEQFLFTWLHSL
jgi:hypothetical protein